MAKIKFTLDAWLKDKSQEVETRDGRIVHNIWRVKEPFYTNNKKAEVCALIDGEEDALVFFEGGRYLPTTQDTDSPFDLFIITPEPELSELELKLLDWLSSDTCGEIPMDEMKKCVKNRAEELLELAERQLLTNDQNNHIWSDGYDTGYERGKTEALKDLPIWRKWGNGACGNGQGIPLAIVKRGPENYKLVDALCFNGEKYIMLSDLEKLPGFKED